MDHPIIHPAASMALSTRSSAPSLATIYTKKPMTAIDKHNHENYNKSSEILFVESGNITENVITRHLTECDRN